MRVDRFIAVGKVAFMDTEEHKAYIKALCERVKAARLARGISLRDAAVLTGITFNTIARIERGEIEPTLATLGKLAAGYQVPFEGLVCAKPPKSKKK